VPRRQRVDLAGRPPHLIQRNDNRNACIFADEEVRFYLRWLRELSVQLTQPDR